MSKLLVISILWRHTRETKKKTLQKNPNSSWPKTKLKFVYF